MLDNIANEQIPVNYIPIGESSSIERADCYLGDRILACRHISSLLIAVILHSLFDRHDRVCISIDISGLAQSGFERGVDHWL